jgi:hypothetical protein
MLMWGVRMRPVRVRSVGVWAVVVGPMAMGSVVVGLVVVGLMVMRCMVVRSALLTVNHAGFFLFQAYSLVTTQPTTGTITGLSMLLAAYQHMVGERAMRLITPASFSGDTGDALIERGIAITLATSCRTSNEQCKPQTGCRD